MDVEASRLLFLNIFVVMRTGENGSNWSDVLAIVPAMAILSIGAWWKRRRDGKRLAEHDSDASLDDQPPDFEGEPERLDESSGDDGG